jgi:hypothetical protein
MIPTLIADAGDQDLHPRRFAKPVLRHDVRLSAMANYGTRAKKAGFEPALSFMTSLSIWS